MSRSLGSSINSIDTINKIRLSLRHDTGKDLIWILVEGKNDTKIYSKFINGNNAEIDFVGGGKIELEKALKTLIEETKQVIGIRDADFLHLKNKVASLENLFLTDYHDIEMTMLSFEDVRSNLFYEYNVSEAKASKLWDNALDEAKYIGYIRWLNDFENLGILFKDLGFRKLVEIKDDAIELNKEQLIEELNKRSINKQKEITSQLISNFIEENKTDDLLNLCNGHDVSAIIGLLLGINKTTLESNLRLSFKIQHFVKTNLYSQLLRWQNENKFDILHQLP